VLSDPSKEVATAYGVVHEGRAYPERWTFIIDTDGTILDILTKVDTGSHGAEIAVRLKELGVAKR
jgi:peroxiredoxin Q/BCP